MTTLDLCQEYKIDLILKIYLQYYVVGNILPTPIHWQLMYRNKAGIIITVVVLKILEVLYNLINYILIHYIAQSINLM